MKKTLVALAVTAFAASASAVTVYNNEGTKVDVNTRVNFAVENTTKDKKRSDLFNKGSRITVNGQQAIAEGYKAVGQIEIRPNFEGGVSAARLWAGLSADKIGTLTFGRQLTNGDGLGLSDFTNLYGGVNQVAGFGPKVVKFTSASFAGFTFGADYLFGQSDRSKKATDLDTYRNGAVVGVFYNNKVSDDFTFKANLGYSTQKYDLAHAKSEERRAWTAAVGATVGAFDFGVDYSEAVDTSKTNRLALIFDKGRGAVATGLTKARLLEVGGQYKVSPSVNVYTAFKHAKGNTANQQIKDTYNEGILGTTYFFNKNVRAYVEGAVGKYTTSSQGVKSSHRDNKIGAGFRLDF